MKNEFVITKKLYMEWCRENMWKGNRLKMKIVWIFTALLTVLFNVLVYISGDGRMYLYAYGVFVFLFCIYRAFFRDQVLSLAQFKRITSYLDSDEWVRTVEFGEDDIISTDGNVTVRTPYSEISGIRDEGNNIWLDTKKKGVIRLYKDKFIGGDFEKFRKLISVKMGV